VNGAPNRDRARRSRARSLGCCAAAGLLVTCEIVPRRAGAFVIRRYIAWRNRRAQGRVLREVVKRANVA
jgi:hypothetical protein